MLPEPIIAVPDHAPLHRKGRVAVLASGRGSNFAALLDAIDEGSLHAEVVGLVYNRPDAGCAKTADARGVTSRLVDHTTYDRRAEFDADVVGALQALEPDLVVMAGWMRIATATLIDAFPDRILNIHPSLLPSFRGMNAVGQALDAGVMIAGCTVHVVRLEVDDGPIVGQAAVVVGRDDDEASLHARIQRAEHLLYPAAIQAYLAQLEPHSP